MTREEKMDKLIQAELESMSKEDLLRIASEQLFAEYRDESDEYIDEQYARHDFTDNSKQS